ncbi:lipopolysaccharide-binding protein-like [Acanthaster planci]|uniref:Lipopolysaccharide-binding protein-like n=1 Tax=Acanthaster planci TaxID=133434 RepID=A0A8B7YXP7_ACAPL|nr:lipopolysaccharide-binding protein-like [Acanthaster planci]
MAFAVIRVLMVAVVFVITSALGFAEVKPGFKARISQSGLNYLRDAGLQILREEIIKMDIPDLSGDAHVPVVGSISYTISDMHITSFSISSAVLTTSAGVGVVLQANGISLSLHGNWRYRNHGWIRISDSGSFDASLSGAHLALTLRIGIDQAGRPTVSSASSDCSFNSGSVHVKLHGGASWLYNLFSGSINKAIENSLNKQTCSVVIREVNTDLARQFSTLKTEAAIDRYAVIDYSFVSRPEFSGHIDTAHKGEVFPRGKPRTEAPFNVPTIPADPDVSHHAFLWITDYLFETAGYVYYKAGRFAYNVTQDKLPKGPFSFNTSSEVMKRTLPEVCKKYPNMLLQVNAKATAPPVVRISEANFNVLLKVDLDFFVILPSKSLAYLFTLNATVNGSTLLSCNGTNLLWSSNSLDVDISLKKSAIGKIEVKPLSEAVHFLTNFFLLPWINKKGETGFPLPTNPNIKFQAPVIKQGKGFIKLGVNVHFTPSVLLI